MSLPTLVLFLAIPAILWHVVRCKIMTRDETLLRLAERAGRTGGVLTLSEAVGAGASGKVMAALVRSGAYRRPHPGVFVLAGAPRDHSVALRAAVAALGPGAAASHRSAAWLHGLIAKPPTVAQVTVQSDYTRCLAGVEVHRSGLPVPARPVRSVRATDAARTVVDFAATAASGELAMVVDRALAAGLVRLVDLVDSAGSSDRRGSARVRRCLEERGLVGGPEPSVLESAMVRLLVRHGLPLPRAELLAGPLGCYRLDFAYPERKLASEVSGYTWHHSAEQLTRDHARLRALTLQGWMVLTYTWMDVVHSGEVVAAEIAAAYRLRGLGMAAG